MKYKLEQIADVFHGSIRTRIASNNEEGTSVETISYKELSYYCNETNDVPEKSIVNVASETMENCVWTKNKDIILSLFSGNAMIIEEERTNKYVQPNCAVIRIKDTNIMDPYYLAWLLNDSDDVKKQLSESNKGITTLRWFTLSEIKNIDLDICDIDKQHKIGYIYSLARLNTRIKMNEAKVLYKLINAKLNESEAVFNFSGTKENYEGNEKGNINEITDELTRLEEKDKKVSEHLKQYLDELETFKF